MTAIAAVLAFSRPQLDSHGYQVAFTILVGIALVVFFALSPRKGYPIWASVSFLFAVSYSVVNLNIPILRLLGIEVTPLVHEFIWTGQDIYNLTFATSSIGLICFLTAVAAVEPTQGRITTRPQWIYHSTFIPTFAIVFFGLFLATSGSYVLGDYTNTGALGISSYFYKLFKVSLTALVIMKVTNYFAFKERITTFRAYLGHLGGPLLTTLVPFMMISFVVGDRGPMIFFSLLAFGPFWASRSGVGLIATILIAYAMALFLSILGAARQARFGGETFLDRILNEVASESFLYHTSYRFDQPVLFGHTLELAASVRVLNHVAANVPANFAFGFGTFSGQQIASIFPGVGGLINKVFFDGNWWMDGSSNFVTYLIQGPYPNYGDGTSVTGELYLDFGIYGVMVGLFLFGLFVGRNEYRITSGPEKITFAWVCIMVYFANSLYLARSSLFLELSNVILVYLLLIFAAHRRPVGSSRALQVQAPKTTAV